MNKQLTGKNGTLKVIAKIDMSPHSYLRSYDLELIGAEVDFIYRFAREHDYGLSFTHATVDEELVEALQQKKADIAIGFFTKRKDDTIDMTDPLYSSTISLLVRYGNIEESINWTTLYGSIEEFNGENIGVVSGSFYDKLSEKYFADSTFFFGDSIYALIKKLLAEEIEGFIYDQPVVEFYVNLFQHRLAMYKFEELEDNQNALGFQKTEEGEALAKEFNEFIKTLDLPALKKKWEAPDWSTETMELLDNSDLKVDTELNPKDKLLTVGFNFGIKPLAFYSGNEPAGFEVEVVYLFAKARHYNLKIIDIDMGERLSLIKEKKVDITGGSLSITDERKQFMIFSDPIYSCGTVLAVRIDSKKDLIPIEVTSANYTVLESNVVDVDVKFSDDQIRTSACVFPEYFNDTLSIQCTIDDIKGVDLSKGFEHVNTDNKILLLYNYIEANNFLQANTLIEGHSDIIQQSPKNEEIICETTGLSSLSSLFGFSNNSLIAAILGSATSVAIITYLISLCRHHQ